MQKITQVLILLISIASFSQMTTKDNIEIEIKKSKLVDNVSVVGIRQLKVKSDELRKVMIKTKIKSPKDNKTRLSGFSLIDEENKIRYRLADYKGYTGFIGSPELIPYRKTELFDKKGNPINYGPPFDKSEKDIFNDYDIDGYVNFEIPVNFGTKKNPNLSVLYFGQTRYKKFTGELFFTLLAKNTNLVYQLYYKDEKISDIKF
ncbi:hypothetical protein [Sediminibacter sp. Hel_I_10]|uniref:hypothetical protein n=1 Tax=Sediminibacter sp. Hel_I_10 TaxID=1392490 RepID=UPI00056560BE|nr:hypothetical protein [Sediminibacter sp. Hel_I_10]